MLFAESLQDESWKIVGVGVFSTSSDRYRSIGSKETGIKKELALGV